MANISISASFATIDSKKILGIRIFPTQDASASRKSFHLALLLDSSGSMDGERIETVKRTLHLLINALADGDTLTLIEYSHAAEFVATPTILSDATRAVLHGAVDLLHAAGGTNLEAGISKLSEISSTPPDAVFILTDGFINSGIASAAGLQRLLIAAIPAETPVNTLGYGADHNSRLLRDIAMKSRGTYTFADAGEMIPAIIGDITAGLAAEVGRGAKLTISEGWRVLEIGETAEGRYTIGTLIAEKAQWIVLEGTDTASAIPTLVLESSTGAIPVVIDDTIPGIEVAEQYIRARVAATFERVSDLVQSGGNAEALTALQALQEIISTSVAKDRTLVISLRAQIDDMLESLRTMRFPAGRPGAAGGASAGGVFLSRLASNTVSIGMQRGMVSVDPAAAAGGAGETLTHMFSSPAQRHTANEMVSQFTQEFLS